MLRFIREPRLKVKPLDRATAFEIAGQLELGLDTNPYRERTFRLARAISGGESRRAIEKQRDLVVLTAWDETLRDATKQALRRRREELERGVAAVVAAEADIDRPPTASRIARAIVDRVTQDLLTAHDKNIAALERLEADLRDAPADDRAYLALKAVRGAGSAAGVPRNEVRAAIVRAARGVSTRGLNREDVFEAGVEMVARALATDERRARARDWVAALAQMTDGRLPLLAYELGALASAPLPRRPAEDRIWLTASLGLALEHSLPAETIGCG